jgi:hypothetical protein
MEDLNITEKITIFKGFSWATTLQTVIAMSMFGVIMFVTTRVSTAYGNSENVTVVAKDVEVLKSESATTKTQYLLVIEKLRNLQGEFETSKRTDEEFRAMQNQKIDLIITLLKGK